jgi:hypothetical protein
MTRRASLILLATGLLLGCRDTAPLFTPAPIVSRAVVTGHVTAPNGLGVAAQLVYVYSDFTSTCGPTPTQLGFMRTNGAGDYLFERVVAPDERDSVCVTVVVRPETNTGFAITFLQGHVSFRFLPPVDTLRIDLSLAP